MFLRHEHISEIGTLFVCLSFLNFKLHFPLSNLSNFITSAVLPSLSEYECNNFHLNPTEMKKNSCKPEQIGYANTVSPKKNFDTEATLK